MVSKKEKIKKYYEHKPSVKLGAILIFIGVIWLGKEMGWIPPTVPIWPLILIIIGLLMLFAKRKR